MGGYWYFSQKSWFQLVLHPAWHFTWCSLHLSYISRLTIYSLDYSFPNLDQSVVSCPALTVAYWLAYTFPTRQAMCSGIPISLKIFHIFFMTHTVKGIGVVNQQKWIFQWMLSIWSLVPLPFLNPAWTFGGSWFMIVEAYLGGFWVFLC